MYCFLFFLRYLILNPEDDKRICSAVTGIILHLFRSFLYDLNELD